RGQKPLSEPFHVSHLPCFRPIRGAKVPVSSPQHSILVDPFFYRSRIHIRSREGSVPSKNGGGVSIPSASLGERVRSARKGLGMSQAQLAGDELTKGFISQLESGSVRPSIRSLQIIASRLGKPLDHFLGDEVLSTEKRVAFHRLAAEAAAE